MNVPVVFRAPWGRTLRVMSIVSSILLVLVYALAFPTVSVHASKTPNYWLWLLPPALLIGCALFTVRGYAVADGELRIERLFWATRIPLEGLISARAERNAMRKSIRTCGNGGMYSFTGWYWSRELGHYRAFVTDLNETVVLRFASRTIVVSPENANAFVQAVTHGTPSRAS